MGEGCRRREEIDGDLEVGGTTRWDEGLPPGLREQVGQLLEAVDASGPLDDWRERRQLVRQLVEVPPALANQVPGNLAGNGDHRDVGARRLHQGGQRVQRARTGGEEERRRASADPRGTTRRQPGVQLGTTGETPYPAAR